MLRRRAVQPEPFGGAQGHRRADFGMLALLVVFRLAHVVQQQRQVKQARAFEALKERRVIFVRLVLGLPNAVQLLQADQRVFVGGVLMVKLVLHQAGEPAEFGNVFAEQVHLVHRAQDRAPLRRAVREWSETFRATCSSFKKSRSTSESWLRMSCARSGCSARCRCCACRNTRISRRGESRKMRLDAARISPSTNLKPSTDSRFAPPPGQPGAQRKPARRRRQQRHALFQRARDEEDVPHVRVEVAHEFLDAFARRAVAVAEIVRHGGLQVLAQHVERTVDVVVQFRPRAQQKIIGGLQLPALGVRRRIPAAPVRAASACGI